jgi:uncharacterized membrane protein YidH (DUF202 family)
MVALIVVFGTLTFAAGFQIAIDHERICSFLGKHAEGLLLHVLNVTARVVFGLLMLFSSSQSKFPLITDGIGWFCLVIALLLTSMGRERFKRSFAWAIDLVEANSRVAGSLIMAFGAFLIYAFA